MNEKLAQLLETLKANKGIVIRVAGVAIGAAVGVAVASMVLAAQESALESEGLIDLESEDEETDIEE